MKRVFIDGSAGTTGLQIHERLSERTDIELNILSEEFRKDPNARREAINEADIAFLCLPDDAATEAAEWCENPRTVIIDTSTAHRTAPGWVYGFPELATRDELIGEHADNDSEHTAGTRMKAVLSRARRIANPGCHASGFIALVSPLIQAGLISCDEQLSCFSVTGYTGGGKHMIADYEEKGHDSPRVYGLTQEHKHLPEIMALTGLRNTPVFVPVVGSFARGMEVIVPLFARQVKPYAGVILSSAADGRLPAMLRSVYSKAYPGPVVHFEEKADENGFMAADKYAGRDDMEITVAGNDDRAVLIARFDNLGKGASGAAIQNMNLVLGCGETTGLVL